MNRLQKHVAIVLLASLAATPAYAAHDEKKKETADNERATQKALLMLAGAGGIMAVSKLLQGSNRLDFISRFSNLKAGEFQAACGLSGALSAIGLISSKEYARTFRSMAWRIPVMAAVGGIATSEAANSALSTIPLGVGSWFKENPVASTIKIGDQNEMVVKKAGIFAIYAIGMYAMLKPSLDRIENYVAKKVDQVTDYLTGESDDKAYRA